MLKPAPTQTRYPFLIQSDIIQIIQIIFFYLGSYPPVQSNYFDNNSTIYQQQNPTIQPCPPTYNFFGGGTSIYQELNLSENNFSEDNCDIDTNLTIRTSENTSTINIDSGSNVNILSPII
jgi:hypothetical protein